MQNSSSKSKLLQTIDKTTYKSIGPEEHLHKNSIWCCGWSPDGKILATSGADKFIHLWYLINAPETPQLKHLYTIQPLDETKPSKTPKVVEDDKVLHTRTVRFVSFHPKFKQSEDGKEFEYQFVSCGFEGRICVWNLKLAVGTNNESNPKNVKCECKTVLEGHKNEVKCVHWSPDGKYLATSGRDKTVWIWEYIPEDDEYMVNSICSKHTQDVKFVRFHPFATEMGAFSGSYDNQIRIWKHPSFNQTENSMEVEQEEDNWVCDETRDVLSGHQGTIWCLSFPNSQKQDFSMYMTSAGDDDSIFVWKFEKDSEKKWVLKQQLKTPHFRPIFHLDWSLPQQEIENENTCDSILLTCSGDNNIISYSLQKKENEKDSVLKIEQQILGAHEADINCVKWNPNPKWKNLFVSVSDDRSIKLWEYNF